MRYRKGKTFHLDAAKRECIRPEKLDMLLHGDVLKNPSLTQPKENDVPDLNSALRTALENGKREFLHKTLNAWDEDEQKQIKEKPTMTAFQQPTVALADNTGRRVFGVTNNVTRATFNYIRDHSGCTSGDACDALVPLGYKTASITPIISQLIKCGTIERDRETRQLRALVTEYQPITSASQKLRLDNGKVVLAKDVKPKRMYVKRQQPQGIAALATPEVKEEAPRASTSLIINRNWTAQGVVDKLSVVQARQLYDVLKQIFGG